jgi:ATP-dependent RNA helicase RhlE
VHTASSGRPGHIHLKEVEVFILDEVDRMLDMGFLPDIKRVLAKVPEKRQTMFFSATLANSMRSIAQTIVTDPVEVTISPETPAVERIDQRTGKRTEGIVADILTKSSSHPRGIKVRLTDGQVGRVQETL